MNASSTGPVQSGKTLIFFVIPILYHLFELQEDVICGVPIIETAQGIYEERVKRVLLKTRYKDLIADSGSGSKGGKFLKTEFKNGATLRFMGAGGGDGQRSTHTAPCIVNTECDKMDKAGKTSKETSPINQIIARGDADPRKRKVFNECTISNKEGFIYKHVTIHGSHHRLFFQCPECRDWIYPVRENFIGWQDADNVYEAREKASYLCDKCNHCITELERNIMLANPKICDKNQAIDTDGNVTGERVPTNIFGFQWNKMGSNLVEMADIADNEYKAKVSENYEDLKRVHQFDWSIPYDDNLTNLSTISRDMILNKMSSFARGHIPEETTANILTIDLGMHQCWWNFWSFTPNSEGFLVDYDSITVPQERQTNPIEILTSLREFRDSVIEFGWIKQGEEVKPDLVIVDSSYQNDIAYEFCKESKKEMGIRFYPFKGFGSARNQKSWTPFKKAKDRRIGHEWAMIKQNEGSLLIHGHSDYWKRMVHKGFEAEVKSPGSLYIFSGPQRDHLQFCRQQTAEREEEEFIPGQGMKTYWNQIHKDNHYFDCSYMALVGASIMGINLIKRDKPPVKEGHKRRTSEHSGKGYKIGR